MKNANLLTIQNTIRLNGGITYNLNTGETNPDTGFMVSLAGYEHRTKDLAELADYVRKHAYLLSADNRYLGVWVNTLLGTISERNVNEYVFDVSEIIADKQDAIEAGILRNQLAIWDNAKKDSIELPLPQACGTETQKRTYALETAKRLAI